MDTDSQPSPEQGITTFTYTCDRNERLISIDDGNGPMINPPPIPADQFEPRAPGPARRARQSKGDLSPDRARRID